MICTVAPSTSATSSRQKSGNERNDRYTRQSSATATAISADDSTKAASLIMSTSCDSTGMSRCVR